MSERSHASELERAEGLIVAHLKERLGNEVYVDLQPDDPNNFDLAGKNQSVLVHYGASQPSRTNAVRLSGPVLYAIIINTRSLRGVSGGYRLVEAVEQAMAGAQLAGCREFTVIKSELEDQAQGIWRWVVQVETELTRGAIPAEPKIFVDRFGDA